MDSKTIEDALDYIKNNKQLDSDLTFDNYNLNDSTDYIYNLVIDNTIDMILNKKSNYNPLYFYGDSGSGKTHFVSAYATFLKEKGFKVFYITYDRFIKLLNYRNDTIIKALKEKIFDSDCVFFEDVQLIKNGSKDQNQLFFNIFNELFNDDKLMVFTANCMPEELDGVEERIRIRFQWGLFLPFE